MDTATTDIAQAARLRQWERVHAYLDTWLEDAQASTSGLLAAINLMPDAEQRQELWSRLEARLAHDLERLDAAACVDYLATLKLLDRRAALATACSALHARLPADARAYFARMLGTASDAGTRRPRIWCVGLSRTGTLSLHGYAQALGMMSQHWTNAFTATVLDHEDAMLFDVVSDTPIVYLARTQGLPADGVAVATTRDYASWSESFSHHLGKHFATRADEQIRDFARMQALFFDGKPFRYGQYWWDIHHELYYRHRSLREAYDCHHDWIATIAAQNAARCVVLPLDAPDKAALLAPMFGPPQATVTYPHANRRKPPRRSSLARLGDALRRRLGS